MEFEEENGQEFYRILDRMKIRSKRINDKLKFIIKYL